MTIAASSLEDIKAEFVHQRLDPITNQPTYKDIVHLQDQLIRNAATLESMLGSGNNGLSGFAKFSPVYLLCTGVAFIHPGNPGEAPAYPPMITNAQRTQIQQQHAIALKNYLCCQHMDLLLKNLIEQSWDNMWFAGIHTPTHGFGNRLMLDVL
eukprot:661813-Ditylum_brightwellii.AAC.1